MVSREQKAAAEVGARQAQHGQMHCGLLALLAMVRAH